MSRRTCTVEKLSFIINPAEAVGFMVLFFRRGSNDCWTVRIYCFWNDQAAFYRSSETLPCEQMEAKLWKSFPRDWCIMHMVVCTYWILIVQVYGCTNVFFFFSTRSREINLVLFTYLCRSIPRALSSIPIIYRVVWQVQYNL